jgi:hypothetical protein
MGWRRLVADKAQPPKPCPTFRLRRSNPLLSSASAKRLCVPAISPARSQNVSHEGYRRVNGSHASALRSHFSSIQAASASSASRYAAVVSRTACGGRRPSASHFSAPSIIQARMPGPLGLELLGEFSVALFRRYGHGEGDQMKAPANRFVDRSERRLVIAGHDELERRAGTRKSLGA